jgi:SAM-dependent methyltransferase
VVENHRLYDFTPAGVIYLLSKGCLQYNGIDVNDLMNSTPESFYEKFFDHLENTNNNANLNFLKNQFKEMKTGKPSRLNYVLRRDFDIVTALGESTVDLVFSQAAFEHFDDIDTTISQLSTVCKPGAILVAEIDLKSHSRWIRDKDPNNIYRYPNWLYNKFWFRGIPNRVRPFQYKETFERYGWTDISITPLKKIEKHYHCRVHKNFADKKNQMDHLSIMLCAKNGKKVIKKNV